MSRAALAALRKLRAELGVSEDATLRDALPVAFAAYIRAETPETPLTKEVEAIEAVAEHAAAGNTGHSADFGAFLMKHGVRGAA